MLGGVPTPIRDLEETAFAAFTTSSEMFLEHGLAIRRFLKATCDGLPRSTRAKLRACLTETELACTGWRGLLALLRRRRVLAFVLLVLAVPMTAAAQASAGAVPHVGVLMFTDITPGYREAFRQGLREHGYVEGQSVVIEWRAAAGRKDRAAAIAAEFSRSKVDVIVATLTPAVQAAKDATGTIPIVMAPAGDPVGQGFVASLARPGGNITGVTGLTAEISGKRLQLLRDMIPGVSRVAVLINGEDPFAKPFLLENETSAKAAGLQLHVETVRRPEELEAAFARIAKGRSAAVIVQPSLAVPAARASQVATLASRHGLPTVSQSGDFAESGGLFAYGVSFTSMVRRAAEYVDRILKGAKPADMPVEQATKFELVVNQKTAKALRIVVPPSVLVQADRVIE
jgi:putative ABC transport system substrate-binding protein